MLVLVIVNMSSFGLLGRCSMVVTLRSSIITGVLLLGALQLRAQTPKDAVIVQANGTAVTTQASGGSVKIPHGLGVVSNRSSLELQWIMVTD